MQPQPQACFEARPFIAIELSADAAIKHTTFPPLELRNETSHEVLPIHPDLRNHSRDVSKEQRPALLFK
jgi:hypothetical protein